MLKKIVKIIPDSILVYLWKNLKMPKVMKDRIIWHTNSHFLGAIIGIITNDKQEVLLLKHTYRGIPWGVPTGWMEHEEPCDALEREVYEETNIKISANRVWHAKYTPSPSRLDIIIIGSYKHGQFKASPEISEGRFFAMDELPKDMPEDQIEILNEYFQSIEKKV